MKRVMLAFLALLMVMISLVPAFAAEQDNMIVPQRYAYIKDYNANLQIDETSGIALCRAHCQARGNYVAKVECSLQRLNGSTWITVGNWTSSAARHASINQNWAVSPGYTYRLYATFYACDASGSMLEKETAYETCVYP